MEISDQRYCGNTASVTNSLKAEWAQATLWTQWRREKSLAFVGNRATQRSSLYYNHYTNHAILTTFKHSLHWYGTNR